MRRAAGQRVLVVAAHPDDEVLGMGGTIAWHHERGDQVAVLILGEGVTARFSTRTQAHARASGELATLRRHMALAHKRLGVTKTFHRDFPDNRFDAVDLLDLVKVVEEIKQQVRPHVVYTNHTGDLNVDHRLTAEAVMAACRPVPGEMVERVLSFAVLSSTEWAPPTAGRAFLPNVFVDIGKVLERKLRAMAAYEGELRPWPHPRSLEGLQHQARLWGATSGMPAAEAFMLIRERLAAQGSAR